MSRIRKPFLLLVALLATAGLLTACDNGTYTFGVHSTSGYRYEAWGNPCGISYQTQSLVGNRLLVESHPSRNGQQYGLLGCTNVAPMFYNEFEYPFAGYPGNPYLNLSNGESRMYVNYDPLAPEIPVGAGLRSQPGAAYQCEYRLHYNWPGDPAHFSGYWTRLATTGSVVFSNTAATIVEFRPLGGLGGRNCTVQRVS